MKQGLHLKLGQQLTMTPQLQQAIRLLQLSTLDLQQEIQQALQENPMLEVEEDGAASRTAEARAARARQTGDGPLDNPERSSNASDTSADATSNRPCPTTCPSTRSGRTSCPRARRRRARAAARTTTSTAATAPSTVLHDHLRWQLNLTRLSDTDRAIALAIIDATDDSGRLTSSIEELLELFPDEEEIEVEEVTAVLHALQQFEPVGVFARDLQECLLLQLRQLPADTPWMDQARILINRHINQTRRRRLSRRSCAA
jgi:RNA polymerase sigma-54 factor